MINAKVEENDRMGKTRDLFKKIRDNFQFNWLIEKDIDAEKDWRQENQENISYKDGHSKG